MLFLTAPHSPNDNKLTKLILCLYGWIEEVSDCNRYPRMYRYFSAINLSHPSSFKDVPKAPFIISIDGREANQCETQGRYSEPCCPS